MVWLCVRVSVRVRVRTSILFLPKPAALDWLVSLGDLVSPDSVQIP